MNLVVHAEFPSNFPKSTIACHMGKGRAQPGVHYWKQNFLKVFLVIFILAAKPIVTILKLHFLHLNMVWQSKNQWRFDIRRKPPSEFRQLLVPKARAEYNPCRFNQGPILKVLCGLRINEGFLTGQASIFPPFHNKTNSSSCLILRKTGSHSSFFPIFHFKTRFDGWLIKRRAEKSCWVRILWCSSQKSWGSSLRVVMKNWLSFKSPSVYEGDAKGRQLLTPVLFTWSCGEVG